MYAVTTKDFKNYQFFGIEMFYEFYENLKILDQLAERKRCQIIVKPHPSELKNLVFLKKRFSNLEFSKDDISKILSEAKVTISFSSTVIEDLT